MHGLSMESLFETAKVFPNSADEKNQLKKWRENNLLLVTNLWQVFCEQVTISCVIYLSFYLKLSQIFHKHETNNIYCT